VITLFVYIIVAVLLGYLAIWVLGKLAPGHPAIIDNIIWVVVVLFVVLLVARAVGIVDIPVPRLR
jgi:hypothetical protein